MIKSILKTAFTIYVIYTITDNRRKSSILFSISADNLMVFSIAFEELSPPNPQNVKLLVILAQLLSDLRPLTKTHGGVQT